MKLQTHADKFASLMRMVAVDLTKKTRKKKQHENKNHAGHAGVRSGGA
jgi:hypothetical protein